MNTLEKMKTQLMVYAINADYFGYGSSCTKLKNGKYRSIVDCEKYDYLSKELSDEWDGLDILIKKDILKDVFNL